jgi:hypothetical protein
MTSALLPCSRISNGTSTARSLIRDPLVQNSRFSHQNQALDRFGLFWCRIPVQNYPHEIGYARVSTAVQSIDAQVRRLRAAGARQVFREVASGAKTNRERHTRRRRRGAPRTSTRGPTGQQRALIPGDLLVGDPKQAIYRFRGADAAKTKSRRRPWRKDTSAMPEVVPSAGHNLDTDKEPS